MSYKPLTAAIMKGFSANQPNRPRDFETQDGVTKRRDECGDEAQHPYPGSVAASTYKRLDPQPD
jgi:hypothetical protein